mgnify:CR=1 FL=1
MSDWGKGAKNNTIGWGQGACDNTIGWGTSQKDNNSWSGDTDISGCSGAAGLAQIDNLNSMSFDGASDFIDCGNDSSLSISGDLTISAWLYIDAHKNYNGVVSKISSTDRNYEILFRSTGNVSFYTQATGGTLDFTTSTTIIPINTWANIIITVDSGVTNGTKFYFNGVQDTTTGTHTVVGNTANLNIGRRTTNSFYMNGKIDEVGIFNVALTEAEILSIYNATEVVDGVNKTADLSQLTTPPIAWYRM